MTLLFIKSVLLFLQISPGPGSDDNLEEDKNKNGGDDNEAPEANPVSPESINRSSSFLFDSLYDSSLLAGLTPQQILDQSDEEEPVAQDVKDKWPLPSTQEQQRSELLANQEAEKQEAIQWGESSFNLSEWGDSLLVGEYFLERQSSLRHIERTQKEQQDLHHQAQQRNTDHVLPKQHLANLQSEPNKKQPQSDCIAGHVHNIKQLTSCQNYIKPGGRQGWINKETESGEQVEKDSKQGKIHVLSDNVPGSTPHCSPGLQEIFDRWPSISEQSWQNPTTGHTDSQILINAAHTVKVPALPQPTIPVGRKRGELNVQSAAAESDSHLVHLSRHDTGNVPERPSSAGDLISPTQETPPVTPRVKLTTSSVQSPLTAQPLNQSTPSGLGWKPAAPKCPESRTGTSNLLPRPVPENEHLTSVSRSTTETNRMLHTDPKLGSPQACASRSIPWPKLPSDTESPVNEGFSLQLSQDESLCSSNSGTFSIIDVASDRCLFDTFIKEWKTRERYSLALACEKREHRQQPQNEIGGKHKRGNDKIDFNLQ